jgi:hypothetical protein
MLAVASIRPAAPFGLAVRGSLTGHLPDAHRVRVVRCAAVASIRPAAPFGLAGRGSLTGHRPDAHSRRVVRCAADGMKD